MPLSYDVRDSRRFLPPYDGQRPPCRATVLAWARWLATRGRLLHLVCLFVAGCAAIGSNVTSAGEQPPPKALGNWPQFRGPDGQGHAVAHDLPEVWSETQNIVWKTPLPGRGWSSPVVWQSQIWLTTATEAGHKLHALCVDRRSGRLLRDVVVFHIDDPPEINPKNSYASPTPVIEAGRLYVHFGTMGTACLDTRSGEVLWRNTELVIDHKEGPGSSPILFDSLLIVNCDGLDQQYVVALDKTSGEIVWRSDRTGANDPNPDFRKAYATPLVTYVNGRPQLISPGADRTSGYDPFTGEELWWVDYKGFSNIARPVVGFGMVYVDTGFTRPELLAVRLGGSGNVTDSHVVWRCRQQVPRSPSPLLVGEALYLVSDRGVASCLDARSGELLWRARMGGNYWASPFEADGKLFFFSEEGTATVVAPNRERYEPLSVNRLDGQIMATPAAVDNHLIVRTDSHLYRIEQQRERAATGPPQPER